jgi:hypothetical protein
VRGANQSHEEDSRKEQVSNVSRMKNVGYVGDGRQDLRNEG